MNGDKIISIIEKRLQERKAQFKIEWDDIKQSYDQPFWECKFLKSVIDELEQLLSELKQKSD